VYRGACWYRLTNTKDRYKGPRFTRCHCHPINKIRFITTDKISRGAANTYVLYYYILAQLDTIIYNSRSTGRLSSGETRNRSQKTTQLGIVSPHTHTHTHQYTPVKACDRYGFPLKPPRKSTCMGIRSPVKLDSKTVYGVYIPILLCY